MTEAREKTPLPHQENLGKEQLLAALLKMQSKGRKYVFIRDWREKDTWHDAGHFFCASSGPAGNYLHSCGSWLLCLVTGGLENRYGKFLKSQIKI